MRARISVLAALTAALLMSAVGVASASATEFEASKETGTIESHGGVYSSSTKTYKTEEQVFSVEYETKKSMTVECSKVTDKGSVTKAKAETQIVTAKYTGCEVAGTGAKEIEAEYEFNAGGTVTVKKAITITATNGTCTVSVPAQGPLSKVTYSEITGPEGNTALEIDAAVTGIEWSATGSLASCDGTGSKVGTGKTGSYTGLSTSWFVGGTLKI